MKFCELCLAMAIGIGFSAPSAARKHLRRGNRRLVMTGDAGRDNLWSAPLQSDPTRQVNLRLCPGMSWDCSQSRRFEVRSRHAVAWRRRISGSAHLKAPLAATLTVLGLISVPLP